jgi:hypothetical protein
LRNARTWCATSVCVENADESPGDKSCGPLLVAPYAGQMLAAPFAAPLAAYKKKQQTNKKKLAFFKAALLKE